MTPYDLKTWRLTLGLMQAEAAHLLGVRYRLYRRYETGTIFRIGVPDHISAAVYGANAAIREAEKLLDVIDWPRDGARPWNWVSGEEMRRRTLFAVARHLLDHGKLTGKQKVNMAGYRFYITFPQNLGVPDPVTSVPPPGRPAPYLVDPGSNPYPSRASHNRN